MGQPIFGKYEIIQRLAVGGMGEVFLARQTGIPGFERHAILKSLLPDVAEIEGAIDDFLDEARVVATLNHPNVVSIYEVGLWEDAYVIAMEFIDGHNLSALRRAALTKQQLIPFELSAVIIRDAALGLDHAHHARALSGAAMEIVHRDISPQNIMVRRDGVTKVVDFGIARAATRQTRTQAGVMKGKPSYMPPEQVRGKKMDSRGDQYSLGVVLWELLTGRRLFHGSGEVDLFHRILYDRVAPPSELTPDVPARLDDITMRMLQREPPERFATCREVAVALTQWIDQARPGVGSAEVAAFVESVAPGALAPREPSGVSFAIDEPVTGPRSSQVSPEAVTGEWSPPTGEWTPLGVRDTLTSVKARALPPELAAALGATPVRARLLAPSAPADRAGSGERASALLGQEGKPQAASSPARPGTLPPPVSTTRPPVRMPTGPTPAARATGALSPAIVQAVEAALTAGIGPIAKVLVKRAAAQAVDFDDLCTRLSSSLNEERDRLAFLERVALLRRAR